ncbi:serine/threonine-protein kinase [Streptomyces sp. ME19-01-6]|uniref:serine/threonine-protein kinase n=1 Tax=Streptomyces sp. ME19-01-6 TaxID=3028686 RepID=UPI0029A2FB5E|nr:serine/threonine-protein kinase [Streptomyces sp. ME19-01-6]MDX3231255.1 serine/threonine-protein kinase [Streptomyces sp. ME19-01-6]
MGTVWRARDIALHREVAVKQVRPLAPESASEGSGASRVLRERVLREARALARLSHRHVVTIHQIIDGGEDSYPWLVMELVPGGSLAELLDEGSLLTPEEAARMARQVLAALRAAHAAGICHRDVKPANVMLRPDGDAVLTDFGIAALQRTGPVEGAVGSAPLTATGELIGTPDYLAPERILGTDDDPASDLWSLGMMLYVCVEGHNPLRRPTQLATVVAVLDGEVPPPVRAGALAPVLMELLVPDPAARPSAERLDAMLAAVAEGGAGATVRLSEADQPTQTARVPAPEPGPVPPSTAPSRRRRSWLIAGAAAVAAVLIGVTTYVLGGNGGNGGNGGESKGGGKATSQSNKLKLVTPGTLTVAVDGVRSGSAHNLAAAADDSGWLDKATVEDRDVTAKPGDWVGLDPDLAKALGDQLGQRVKIVGIEVFGPGNPFESLGAQYDMVMPSSEYSSFDAKERESVDFVHYFDSGYTAYTAWKTAQGIHSWADLCGMRVDSDAEEAVQAASYKECGPDPIKQTSWDPFTSSARLRDGSIDAVVTDLPFAVHEAKDSKGAFHLPKGDLVKEAPIGLAVDRANPALRDALRKALNALMDSGEYREILTDWDLEDGAVTSARILG